MRESKLGGVKFWRENIKKNWGGGGFGVDERWDGKGIKVLGEKWEGVKILGENKRF